MGLAKDTTACLSRRGGAPQVNELIFTDRLRNSILDRKTILVGPTSSTVAHFTANQRMGAQPGVRGSNPPLEIEFMMNARPDRIGLKAFDAVRASESARETQAVPGQARHTRNRACVISLHTFNRCAAIESEFWIAEYPPLGPYRSCTFSIAARDLRLVVASEPLLSSELGTYKTVKAISLWPWIEPFFRQNSFKPFERFEPVLPPRSAAVHGPLRDAFWPCLV